MLQASQLFHQILKSIIFHQEDLHEVIQVSVKDCLSIRSLVTGTEILYHLVRMKDIASDLRSPLDLLLLTFEFSLFLLAFLQLDVIEA